MTAAGQPQWLGAELLGLILAGGMGRRMGGIDKGLCALQGRPLVTHVIDALRRQLDDILIVANRNKADYASYAPVISDASDDYSGPMAGLAAAFAQSGERWIVSVPVDCPRPPAALAPRLLQALQVETGPRCAVAHDGARAQPLFALYRPGLAQLAKPAALQHEPVWRWQQDIGVLHVDFSDQPDAFANLNTQADFEYFERCHDPA